MSKFGACVDTTLTWIGNNKLVTLLGLVAFSLMVSTWTLAAINVNLNEEIDDLNNRLTTTTTVKPPGEITDATTTETPVTNPPATVNLRLSEFVIPTLYDLLIHPDLTPDGEGGFSGTEKIYLDVNEPIDEIVLHAHELNVSTVAFTAAGSDVRVLNYHLDTNLEQLQITLSGTIGAGKDYELDIEFNGSMREKIVGLYSSTYKDENGNDR